MAPKKTKKTQDSIKYVDNTIEPLDKLTKGLAPAWHL